MQMTKKTKFKTENDSSGLRTFGFTVFGLAGKISLRLCGRAAGLLCGGGFSERASIKGRKRFEDRLGLYCGN